MLRTPLSLWCASFLATLSAAACGGKVLETTTEPGGAVTPQPAPVTTATRTFACENPMPLVAGGDTGFELCASGFVHRDKKVECPTSLPRAQTCTTSSPDIVGPCQTDADCTAGPNGQCSGFDPVAGGPTGTCSCYYGCRTDADCTAGEICLCGAPTGQCVAADCTSDADCPKGMLCTMSAPPGSCPGASPFTCQKPEDTCGGAADCVDDAGFGGQSCQVSNGRHECASSCAFGRPFLVEGDARTADADARDDWRDPIPALSVAGLAGEERRAIAAAWTRMAAMEHASIAAFARFTMQLLALGAPASLVEASQEAMRDETEHAKACFAVASRFAGRDVGPGPLPMDGALAESDAASVLVTTILEGCIGETCAAVEAAEALAYARDPALRAVLAKIARDERRHAELAWRFVRWAVEEDAGLRVLAECVIERAVADAARDARTSPAFLVSNAELAHGVVPDALRAEVRARVLREVVAPCAEALLGGGRVSHFTSSVFVPEPANTPESEAS
jgi:hypothetical protein